MNQKLFLIEELEEGDALTLDKGDCLVLGGISHMVEDQIQGEDRRWSRTNALVLKDEDGRFWQLHWEEPLTEYQEVDTWSPTEHGNPIHVSAHEVRPIPVQTMTWETVK